MNPIEQAALDELVKNSGIGNSETTNVGLTAEELQKRVDDMMVKIGTEIETDHSLDIRPFEIAKAARKAKKKTPKPSE